jgi:hypothetical protein
MRFSTLLPGLLFASSLGAQSAPKNATDDRAAILAVIDSVFVSMARKDTALLNRQFAPGARLVGVRTRDSSEYMQVLTVEQFGRFIVNDRRDRWTERAHQPQVQIEGTLATVWAPYDFHFGEQLSHCGVDAVQLLRVAGKWSIVSLADTFQRTGCPSYP